MLETIIGATIAIGATVYCLKVAIEALLDIWREDE